METMGDIFGRDRVHVSTVAFGAPDENYDVLKKMAKAVPQGKFEKLGLAVGNLQTSLSTLSTSLSTLRTDIAVGSRLTARPVAKEAKKDAHADRYTEQISWASNWNVYSGRDFICKEICGAAGELMDVTAELRTSGADGVAYYHKSFAEGMERVAYRCTEVQRGSASGERFVQDRTAGERFVPFGPKLVAKETKYVENMKDSSFHDTFCRIQAEAQRFAEAFNKQLVNGGPSARLSHEVHYVMAGWQLPEALRLASVVEFIPCSLYSIVAPSQEREWILAEPELEGKFTKWNNNGGAVSSGKKGSALGQLGGISEESTPISASDVPQCFSHWTHTTSNGKKLICDLQGVWNEWDGYRFTDPAIHSTLGKKHKNGASDQGAAGIRKFFETHTCNALCRRLSLSMPAL